MIEKAAVLNPRIHTSLNGKRIASSISPAVQSSSSSPLPPLPFPPPSSTQHEAHSKDEFKQSEMLESLLNEIAGSESNDGVDMKYFGGLYSAINGEMSSAMMIRDDQVEPDVESFRCLNGSCNVRSRDKAESIWMRSLAEEIERELQGSEAFGFGRESASRQPANRLRSANHQSESSLSDLANSPL